MSKKKCYFDHEKTAKSTRDACDSSNLSNLFDHIPERLSDIEITLARSSWHFETSTSPKASEGAASSLSRIDPIEPIDLTSIPSFWPEEVQTPIPVIVISDDEDSEKDNSNKSETPAFGEGSEDSDALNVKKNGSPNLRPLKSSISPRSLSPLNSLPNGKLPIATTKTEIIWDCVELGKSASHDFVINNTSPNRLEIKCGTANPAFKIVENISEFASTLNIILHPFESRCLSVLFAPISHGAACDLIHFVSVDPTHNQSAKQFIRLFGYGGHACLMHDDLRDTAGRFNLSLGTAGKNAICKNRFFLKNTGNLPSFAHLEFIPSVHQLFSNIKISKQTIVLRPGEGAEVLVTYEFKRQELNYIQSKRNCLVLEIGKLRLFYGTEVNRGRLRQVCAKVKDKGLDVPVNVKNLIAKFPGEVMPCDLSCMKESIGSKQEIANLINCSQIMLTVELQDLASTAVRCGEMDEMHFTSLCESFR